MSDAERILAEEATAELIDRLTAAAGLTTALVQALVEARKLQEPPLQEELENALANYEHANEAVEQARAERDAAIRERDDARQARDTAEALIAKQRAEARQMRDLAKECKTIHPRKRKPK